jgi:hypothetical protein
MTDPLSCRKFLSKTKSVLIKMLFADSLRFHSNELLNSCRGSIKITNQ